MKISLVTISFNQAQYLESTIRSVLNQGYRELEYIVVDAGSIDGSREIIERYRDHITHTIFEPDEGPADGLNKGFARATGEIYGYLNSDDLLLPGALAEVAQAFSANPASDVIYGHGIAIDGKGMVVSKVRSDRFNLRRAAYGNSIIMQQAAFWRARAFHDVEGFNKFNRLSWDGEFWVDLALAGKVLERREAYWGVFRLHEGSITSNFHHSDRFRSEQKRLLQKALGRGTLPRDRLGYSWTRIEKWLVDPVNLFLRIATALKGGRI
jgi:glycosyltransferase involved in cell wall biosynthesis